MLVFNKMVYGQSKIFHLKDLEQKIISLRKQGKKILMCHGHFNVIHPGHLRFLSYARSKADFIVVTVMAQAELSAENKENFFEQNDRALGVANLELVDAVVKSENNLIQMITTIAPDFYLKGKEFEDQQAAIQTEVQAVEKVGGKVLFSSGDVEYNTTPFFSNTSADHLPSEGYDAFIEACEKQDITIQKLKSAIDKFKNLKIAVIGDTIVDQFVACDPLGLSSEAPVMVVRELHQKEFLGGAAIISQHVRSLGADCTYISVMGNDEPAHFSEKELAESDVKTFVLRDESRPTTFKIRYLVGSQKVLRVSRLNQHALSKELEAKFIEKLREILPQMNGVIISDFVYGMITPRILDEVMALKERHGFLVFGDTQCSSQFGDVSKFKNITLITPTEKEARIAMNDQTSGLEKLCRDLMAKTNNDHVVITLGADGILVFSQQENKTTYYSEFFKALEKNPVDLAGAGDAMLSGYALGLCSGHSIVESSLLASCLSAISIMRIGNIPIKPSEYLNYLDQFQKYSKSRSGRNA